MKLIFSIFLACLITGCATTPRTDDARKEQVDAALTAWRTAFDSRDSSRIVAMYDSDAVVWGTNAKTIASTTAGIADYFKGAETRPNNKVSIGEHHIRVYGDVATIGGYYTFSDIRDGQPTSRPARFSMVFRNRDGKWLIVAHHSSIIP